MTTLRELPAEIVAAVVEHERREYRERTKG
jgi:hypothetical protein